MPFWELDLVDLKVMRQLQSKQIHNALVCGGLLSVYEHFVQL